MCVFMLLSLADVTADMLAPATRKLLKGFAAELCGLLLHNLRVNVQGHIYSKGATATLLGRSLEQQIEESETEELSPAPHQQDRQQGTGRDAETVGPSRGYTDPGVQELPAATLILLDRSLDLELPTLLGSEEATKTHVDAPFIHRVLAVMPRRRIQYHTNTDHANATPTFAVGYDVEVINAPAIVTNGDNVVHSTVVAEGALPCKVAPSLAPPMQTMGCDALDSTVDTPSGAGVYDWISTARMLRQSMLLNPADKFLRTLRTELRKAVKARGGVLPPLRKRETSQEVRALTQALLSAPGKTPATESELLMETVPLLAVANIVLETMARCSGGIDLDTLPVTVATDGHDCIRNPKSRPWKCSLPERQRRERALIAAVDTDGFLGGLGVIKDLIGRASRARPDMDSSDPTTGSTSGGDTMANWSLVADVEHWVMLLGQLFLRRRRAQVEPADTGPGDDGWTSGALDVLDAAAAEFSEQSQGRVMPPGPLTASGGEASEDLDCSQLRSLMGFDDLPELLAGYLLRHCGLGELEEVCGAIRGECDGGGWGLLSPQSEIGELQRQSQGRRDSTYVDVVKVIRRLRAREGVSSGGIDGTGVLAESGAVSGTLREGNGSNSIHNPKGDNEGENNSSFLHMDDSFRAEIVQKEWALRQSLRSPEEVLMEEEAEEEHWVRIGLEKRISQLISTFIELRESDFRMSEGGEVGLRGQNKDSLLESIVTSVLGAEGRMRLDSILSELSVTKLGPALSLSDSLAKVGLGWMFGGNEATQPEPISIVEPEIIVIFVVGGLSYVELALVENALKSHPDSKYKIIVGTTEMKSSMDFIHSIVNPPKLV